MNKKHRKGFSLVELLVAASILSLLGGALLVSGMSAQHKARITSVMTVFDDYSLAFRQACMLHPGIVNDREKAWGSNGSSYSTSKGMERIVKYMNESLSEQLKLVLSADGKYYESVGNDPWGGKYVLLEYPDTSGLPGGKSYYDPTTVDSFASMRVSIWCSGANKDITTVDGSGFSSVSEKDVGCTLVNVAGDLSFDTHGLDDSSCPFTGAKIKIK